MLNELHLTKYEPSGLRKRWFQDAYFDLFVWQNACGQITSFQLCYDRQGEERVIVWDSQRGFEHLSVDDGEGLPSKNMSPVFSQYQLFSNRQLIKRFAQSSFPVAHDVRRFVIRKLRTFLGKSSLVCRDET